MMVAAVLSVLLLLSPRAAASAQEPAPGLQELDPHRRRSTLYVAARGSHEVLVLTRDQGEVIAAIPAGKRPSGLAARRDGDRIYVACAGSHAVQVIDGAARRVIDTIVLPHGAAPLHVALSEDARTLYVAASGIDSVLVLDAAGHHQIAEIPVPGRPSRLALSPDGRRLYALCPRAGRLHVIDTSRAQVIASAAVGSGASDLAVDRSRGTVYVARSGAPSLAVLDEGSSQPREAPIPWAAEAVAVDPRTGRLLLSSPAAARIVEASPGTGASAQETSMAEPWRLAVDPEGKNLYALSARRGVLAFVDRIRGAVVRDVPVGKEPWDLVLIP
ncbi:MAG TPA: hypothetical protein VJV23_17075 [Candidatus Polarisedimenticolia bacterium]|nr:hypothetical protein [Candidatus Polarisedimenticolia bacterium]